MATGATSGPQPGHACASESEPSHQRRRSPRPSTTTAMAPATPLAAHDQQAGPHPSFIQVAKPFVFEQRLQGYIIANGANQTREDGIRLQGVHWIDEVRKALHLYVLSCFLVNAGWRHSKVARHKAADSGSSPVRTYNTACVYFHKFRLAHKDNEYQYADAAAAALFTACKIEDTLKKSRDILCASHNLRVSLSEQLTPDDAVRRSDLCEANNSLTLLPDIRGIVKGNHRS